MSFTHFVESLELRQFLSAAKLGSISGSVYSDMNLNAAHDFGETGVGGVYIFLDLNGNGRYDKKTEPFAKTDSRGNFAIGSLKAGTYRVRELTSQNSTTKLMMASALSAPSAGYFRIDLQPGQNAVHRQFANVTMIAANAPASVTGGTTGSSTVAGSVRLSSTARSGTADLNDNDAIFHGPTNGAALDVGLLIRSSRASGQWTSSGITSSAATASASSSASSSASLTAITGAQYKNATSHSGSFSMPAGSTDILVKYTYMGDTDVSGKVIGADYSRIDTSFNNEISSTASSGWYNGDFDYGGAVKGSDQPVIGFQH